MFHTHFDMTRSPAATTTGFPPRRMLTEWARHGAWKHTVRMLLCGTIFSAAFGLAAAHPGAAPKPSSAAAQAPMSLPATSATQQEQKITSALFVSDEWHDLTRKDGTGLYFELVKAVFERQGVKTEFRIYPYARAVQRVKDKEADGWVASFMNEKSFPLYPKYHFDKNEQTIIYLKKNNPTPVTVQSLRNKRVAWLRDFGLDKYIKEPMKINEIDNIESAFQMLEKDRIDYFVGAKSDIEDAIKSSNQDMTLFGMAHALHLGLFMAFADTPRGAQLRQMWDTEMETFHSSEAFKAIYKKYGFTYPFP